MGWEQIRAGARRVVHKTFAREATYTAPGVGESPVPARIRLHNQMVRYGDLDREGFAEVINDVNRVKVDTGEIAPEYGGTVEFGAGHAFRIVNVMPEKDDEFWDCEVQPA